MSTEPAPSGAAPSTPACVATTNLPQVLRLLATSFLVTTNRAGKLIVVREFSDECNTHFKSFSGPLGLAVRGDRIALSTAAHVWQFENRIEAAAKVIPRSSYDACYLPRGMTVTGNIRADDLAWAGDELWLVNTRFSCLCTLDARHSFVPRWRPKFITQLAPEDRCHLSGVAVRDGKPRYVSAFGTADTPGGWRANASSGGVLIDIASDEIICDGLALPISPRWHQGKLWVLEAGHGRLSFLDPQTNKLQSVATVPGFARGLDFVGPHAFIGLSRDGAAAGFAGLPIAATEQELFCGVWIVDTRDGRTVAFSRYAGGVDEVVSVRAVPGILFPEIVNDNPALVAEEFILPEAPQ